MRLTVEITAVGDHLEAMGLGQKLILSPESETSFSEEDSDRKLRFIIARGNRVTAAIISVPEELTCNAYREPGRIRRSERAVP
ncbi:MAG TPA: hypothetical protein VH252_09240 [Chthoniobacterales bacterium]|jgi:hypothetical protein|nr:hypothetical protein [Chthoniobacterales bacterium]